MFSKIILDYFDEDTSNLAIRSDCCDNCANGLSTWREEDLYEGFLSNGLYDFTKDGRLLLTTIQQMEAKNIKTERKIIVDILNGSNRRYESLNNCYGKGENRKRYYWYAMIDLLTTKEYIDFIAGVSHLKLSEKGHWILCQPTKQLHLKPAGAINRFFQAKDNTPILSRTWN